MKLFLSGISRVLLSTAMAFLTWGLLLLIVQMLLKFYHVIEPQFIDNIIFLLAVVFDPLMFGLLFFLFCCTLLFVTFRKWSAFARKFHLAGWVIGTILHVLVWSNRLGIVFYLVVFFYLAMGMLPCILAPSKKMFLVSACLLVSTLFVIKASTFI